MAGYGYAANVRPSRDESSFDIYPAHSSAPRFTVETLHISCKSDTYRGSKHKFGGIIIYARNGETDWYTANNTHCKSGYVVIMQTDTKAFKDLQAAWSNEPGKVHGIIYRKAFGESCKGMKVVGEGFGIMNGKFKIISGVFNPVDDDYHDDIQPVMWRQLSISGSAQDPTFLRGRITVCMSWLTKLIDFGT